MMTNRPLRHLIDENQVLTPNNAMFLAHLDAFHKIVRNARSVEEERKVLAETPGGTRINGVLSDEDIRKLFSFLYLEPSSNGKPFISKEV